MPLLDLVIFGGAKHAYIPDIGDIYTMGLYGCCGQYKIIMKSKIMYIEYKTDQNDRGEAWIGKVDFSKSGQTLYFNDMAFKKMKGTGYAYSEFSNYYDLENRESYWISGIKKDGQDRHWAGGGKIKIDKNIVEDYLAFVNFDILDETNFEIVSIPKTDKQKFAKLENQKLEQ